MAWYRDLFTQEDPMRLDADYYAEREAARMQVDFVVDKLNLQPGARVLDLCCGQGRHLLELTRRGFSVLGYDLSAYMLDRCRELAEKEGMRPELVRGDMRKLDFDSEFNAVINMRTSFGYLESEDEDQKVLDVVYKALKLGGRFLSDQINRDSLMRRYKEQFWVRNSGGDILVVDSRFDVRTGRNIVREMAFHADGSRSEADHDIRLYTCREFEDKLIRAGLRIESVWGDWDSSPFDLEHRHMLIIALKG